MINYSFFVLTILVSTSFLSCTQDDPNPEGGFDQTDSINSEFILDPGSIGLVIDTRDIAKKGYSPSKAIITFDGGLSSFSKTLDVHSSTNIATLSIPKDDLTSQVIDQFDGGVSATITIQDENAGELASVSDNVRVDSSNEPLRVTTDLPALYPELKIKEETPYLIQAITDDEDVHTLLYKFVYDPGYETGLDPILYREFDANELATFSFYFESVNGSDSLFYLKMQPDIVNTPVYIRMSGPGNLYCYYVTDVAQANYDYYKFVVKADENGLVKIRPLSGNPIGKHVTGVYGSQVSYSDSPDEYISVRIVAANITWEVEDRGTEFSPPILPPAKLDFAYKSILKNCSSATLTESVGKSETQSKSYTVGTEESVSLYSSHTASVSLSTTVETSAKFFGQGVDISVEATAGYEYTTSKTTTETNTWEETVTEEVEISRVRDIELQPFTAVEVFDAIQTLENVKVPFVQILRIRGNYNGTDPLSGPEIASQLLANQFSGVVSNIQNDYVEISIKGTSVIEKFFEVESEVNEIIGACD